MANSYKVDAHHIVQFTKNVEHLVQQQGSRLLQATTQGHYHGDKAQAVLQFGEVEMTPMNSGDDPGQWQGDTVWSDIDHYQRWVFPSDFVVSLPLSRPDQVRLFHNPCSPYAEAVKAAYCRKADDLIITAATGTSKTGKYDDLSDTDFPADQIMDHDDEGLTINKLIDAKEKLIAAGCDPYEERFFACSERQLSDLLKSTAVQSADYNSVKALVRGELDTFIGFTFISTERLGLTLEGDAPADGSSSTPPQTPVRHCLAWVKSGLHFGIWDGLEVKTDQRPDKNYTWQVYARATVGATRIQEKKVVRVDCIE